MSAPTLSGLHHVTFPVSDLPAGVSWYERVLRAEHLPGLDHYNSGGKWFAAVLALPGLDVAVQLRLTRGTPVTGGHPPVAFAVRDRAELDRWVNHLDACEVPHPPTIAARIGDSVRFASPDGTPLRIYTGSVDTNAARSADPLSERDDCHPSVSMIALDQARIVVEQALAHARRRELPPMTVAVLDAAGRLVAFAREERSSLLREDIAQAKARGALNLGIGSRAIATRAAAHPHFISALTTLASGDLVPVPGGVLIRDTTGEIVGAVGVSGHLPDDDEDCAIHGITASGLRPDPGE